MNPLNTVKIKDGESYRIINESDFKHGLHELCEGEKLSVQPSVVSGSSTGSAKADLEKLQTENTDLIAELKTALDEKDTFKNQLAKAHADLESERAIHTAFISDVDAMQSRIDELKQSVGSSGDAVEQFSNQSEIEAVVKPAENDYANWTVPQIKEFLASKEIGFKSSASKDELLALIPKE
ncbi:hypothetical protein [Acinetobacter rudis]|uniref:HeH/LEM domain-containing protein n=1 Tax=Acinetobacter rudis TaxID=632955 RepID=A0AAW8JC04_9GAMM|nr:hypothetical protein [Acinetobacter rudis]MDQ8936641.1 hypothetical protein [Acinetobacter rudis]MDQ9018873.1 hypothetical protein [Acinetobacter rudis]